MLKLSRSAGALVALLAIPGPVLADEVFKATTAITLSGGQHITAFDISFVDPVLKLYILADRTNKAVDVIDTTNNSVLAQVSDAMHPFQGATGNNNTSGPDGVMFVDQKEIWAGDGDSTMKIFSWPGKALIVPPLNTGGTTRVDEMCYDPRDHVVLAANNAVTGKFYISVPEINGQHGDNTAAGAVKVINPITMKVEQTWIINHDACAGPQGMAIGPNNQILLGCNAPSGLTCTGGYDNKGNCISFTDNGKFSTVIINTHSGAIISTLNNESGADEVWYNPGDGQYFLARSGAAGPAAGGNQQLGVVDAVGHKEDQSVQTALVAPPLNAHSVAADPHENQVYVPIPGSNAAHPNGVSTICGLLGGIDTQGCIAVFTTTNDDRPRVVREREPNEHQE